MLQIISAYEGRRLAERLVSSFTAEHGIWLNMALTARSNKTYRERLIGT